MMCFLRSSINAAIFVTAHSQIELPLMSKATMAARVLDLLAALRGKA